MKFKNKIAEVYIQYGYQSWRKNGDCHRLNGAAVIYSNGTRAWFQDALRHHLDGPAIIWHDGDMEWYENGNRIKSNEV